MQPLIKASHLCFVCGCASHHWQVSIKKVYASAQPTFSQNEVTIDTRNPEPVVVQVRGVARLNATGRSRSLQDGA